jgi:hypothetical protein
MKDYYLKLNSSIGSYYAEETEELCTFNYAAEFRRIVTTDFKWDNFEAEFYTHGELEDLKINGWTFSHRIEGRYRIYNQMEPDSPEFTVNGVDPEKHLLEIKIYSSGFFKEAAADFMNNIKLISKFPNRDIATVFYKMKNWDKGSKPIDVLPLLKDMNTFYKSYHEEISDELFWDKIRKTVDKTIEDYKKTIDLLAI